MFNLPEGLFIFLVLVFLLPLVSANLKIEKTADVDTVIKTIDDLIGLKKLLVIQVNDSKVELNSKKD